MESSIARALARASMVALLAFCALAATSRSFATIIGVDLSTDVYVIDESTGNGTKVRYSGIGGLNALSGGPNDLLYSVTDFRVATIDPRTGFGSLGPLITGIVGPDTIPDARGMAYRPGDALYAAMDLGLNPTGINDDYLYRIDPFTGVASLIGAIGFSGIQSLAFSPGGQLFAWEIFQGLVEIDLATGLASVIGGDNSVDIQALDFSSSGVLYGARNSLYTIDTSTGATTLVGSGNYEDLRGIAFVEENVSIADSGSTILLLLVSLTSLAFLRLRRQHS